MKTLQQDPQGAHQALSRSLISRVSKCPTFAGCQQSGTLGLLVTLALRLRGLEVTTFSRREPPHLNSELVEALGARYVSGKRTSLEQLAGDYGGFDLIFEAAGFPPLVFEAMQALAKNGVLVISGVAGGDQPTQVPAARITREFVLGNRAMVGTVNANRGHFQAGIRDMAAEEVAYPGWLARLITHRIAGLERYQEMFKLLQSGNDAIKVVMEVGKET